MIKKIACRRGTFLLIALFYLIFVQVARAAPTNVIACYITNTGMYMAIGADSSAEPEKKFFLDQSMEPKLIFDSPSLTFTSSPLKFFHAFWRRHGQEINQLFSDDRHKMLPVEVHISAAGTSLAKHYYALGEKITQPYLNSDQLKHIKKHSSWSQLKSFEYIFSCEIEKWLPGRDITIHPIAEDMASIVNMASLYYHQIKSDIQGEPQSDQSVKPEKSGGQHKSLLTAYITTCSHFCLIDDYTDTNGCYAELKKTNCFSYKDRYINNRIGSDFKQYNLCKCINSTIMKPVTAEFSRQIQGNKRWYQYQIKLDQRRFDNLFWQYQQQEKDHLLSAVYAVNILQNAKHADKPVDEDEASCMFYRLGMFGFGCNLLGDWVTNVLYEDGYAAKINQIQRVYPQYSPECACDHAMNLIEGVMQSLMEEIISITLFLVKQNREENKQYPAIYPLILVGDRIDLLEQYALRKGSCFSAILLEKLQNPQEIDKLFKQMLAKKKCKDKEQFETDIRTLSIPVVQQMIIIPKKQFVSLMYQNALKEIHEDGS